MKLYLIRHGETYFNAEERIHAEEDSPGSSLNDHGIEMVREAIALIPSDITLIACSPLNRARETAAIIREQYPVPVEYFDEIREKNYGRFGGMLIRDVIAERGEEFYVRDRHHAYDYRPFGGESVEDVKNRIQKFFDMLKVRFGNEKVLVVCHGGIIRLIQLVFLHEMVAKIPNAFVLELEI